MHKSSPHRELILASSSPYRKQLLARLHLPFSARSPRVDETPGTHETAAALTQRLAFAKARAIAQDFPAAVVIGSDQVAEFEGGIVGKPGSAENAVAQLLQFSNQVVVFHTAIAVLLQETGFLQHCVVTTEVSFRPLSKAEVIRYVALDSPLDCAGSFKSECAGPMLMQHMTSTDSSAIIGLPLIELARMLRAAGFCLP